MKGAEGDALLIASEGSTGFLVVRFDPSGAGNPMAFACAFVATNELHVPRADDPVRLAHAHPRPLAALGEAGPGHAASFGASGLPTSRNAVSVTAAGAEGMSCTSSAIDRPDRASANPSRSAKALARAMSMRLG